MFLATIWYGYELFTLDEKLSKTKSKRSLSPPVKRADILQSIEKYSYSEKLVADALRQFKIPFEKDVRFNVGSSIFIMDFAIPSHDAKYVIEVKAGRLGSKQYIDRIINTFKLLKGTYDFKAILVLDTSYLSGGEKEYLKNNFHSIIDLHELEKLKDIIRV